MFSLVILCFFIVFFTFFVGWSPAFHGFLGFFHRAFGLSPRAAEAEKARVQARRMAEAPPRVLRPRDPFRCEGEKSQRVKRKWFCI